MYKEENMKRNYLAFILLMMFIILYFNVTNVQAGTVVSVPTKVKATYNFKRQIRISWKKTKNVSGYIIYRDGKKLKNIVAKNKSAYIDKKVKFGEKHSYQIVAYKKVDGRKIKSKKSYKVKVRVTTKKSKKQNVDKVQGTNQIKTIGLGESTILTVKLKVKKELKNKEAFNKKVIWSSSNDKIATVDQEGRMTANNQKKVGNVKIYARAHNGVSKIFKVKVINYARPEQFNKKVFIDEEIRPVLKAHLEETKDIVDYFMYDNLVDNISLDLDDYEPRVKCVPFIVLDDEIENKIYNILTNLPVTIKIENRILRFSRTINYADGSEITYNIYCCLEKSKTKSFDFNVNYSKIANRWYYSIEEKYGEIYWK